MADLEPGWLTVTEIARHLGKADSTVRYWRNRYRTLLPERTNDAGHRCYSLAAFETIAALYARRAPPHEVMAALSGTDASPHHTGTEDRLTEIMDELHAVHAEIASLRELVEQLVRQSDAAAT